MPERRLPGHAQVSRSEGTKAGSRTFTGVREIIAFPEGLQVGSIKMVKDSIPPQDSLIPGLTAARERTYQKRVAEPRARGDRTDFDGSKVWLKGVDFQDGTLTLTTGETRYFDLWGLPGAAPDLHDRYLNQMQESGHTDVPNGIATHNTIITADELVIMTVRSRQSGFATGRVSVSYEEQMELKDRTPLHAAARGLKEEFGAIIPVNNLKLLGLAAEEVTAYTAACHFGEINLTASELVESWRDALDRDEGTVLFGVPLNKIEEFSSDVIPKDVWTSHLIAGEIPQTATLSPHPVVPWRIALVKEHVGGK